MALDADEVRVAGSGGVYVADLGTAFPAFSADLEADDDFTNLGYITEDGATFTLSREVEDIFAWQSPDPIRTINKRVPKTVKFDLMQSDYHAFMLALGGGTWGVAGVAPNEVYTYTPPAVSAVDERAMILELVDGTLKYRWYFKRALNKEGVEFQATRNTSVNYPVSMSILTPADASAPFTFETNDDAVAAPA